MFQLDGRMLAGQMKRVSGGVGRNIADALGRFGHDVCFMSAVGDDSNGDTIIKSLGHIVSILFFRPPSLYDITLHVFCIVKTVFFFFF